MIRERAKKAGGKTATVIENVTQTKRLAETALGGGPSTLPLPPPLEDEDKGTNTGSGSQEEDEEEEREGEDEGPDPEEEGSPDSGADQCQIIANNRLATAFVLESVRGEDR